MKTPNEVVEALKHVRKYVDVDTVVFFKNVTWMYCNSETHTAPSFEGTDIDVSILEAAADSIESFPFIYQM